MDYRKLSIAISAVWLIILLFRLAFYSGRYSHTPGGSLFSTVLNIILVVGLAMMAYFLFTSYRRSIAGVVDPNGRCPQCHTRLSDGDEFCPYCGRGRDP